MGRMAEGSVRSWAVDNGAVVRDRHVRGQIVSVDEGDRVAPGHHTQDVFWPLGKSFRLPRSHVLEKGNERSTTIAKEQYLLACLSEVRGGGHVRMSRAGKDGPPDGVRG